MDEYPDFVTLPILEGKGPDYFVELYNRLIGYKLRTEHLKKPVPEELTNQISKLLEIYPIAEEISQEMRKGRQKEA